MGVGVSDCEVSVETGCEVCMKAVFCGCEVSQDMKILRV